MKIQRAVLLLIAPLLLVAGGCAEKEEGENKASMEKTAPQVEASSVMASRWYSDEQVARGGQLFQQHCASCHKEDASGSPDWKKLNEEGKLPPPPLNGSAHTWHHPLPLLRQVVRNGGIPMGGSMPAFKDKLSRDEIDEILAWVQSHWSDKIYATWNQINQRATKGEG